MGQNQQKLPPGQAHDTNSATLERTADLPATTTMVSESTFSETLTILRKRKWLLLLFLLIGSGYGYFKVVTAPKLYEAVGRIQVRPGASNEFRVNAIGTTADSQTRLGTEVAILQSDTLLLSVARQLKLQDNPDFLGAKGPVPHSDLDNPAIRQATLARLRSGLSVQSGLHTDIIAITYKSLNPKLSADVVNTIINDYIQRSFQTRFSSTQRISEWLSSQLDDLKEQVEGSQEQLMDLQKRLGITGFDATKSQISAQLDDLVKAASEARIQRIIAEAHYRILANADPNSTNFNDISSTNPTLTTLRTQQASLATQFAQLDAQYGPNYIDVKKSRAQLEEIEKAIEQEQARSIAMAKQTYMAARTNEDMTNAALEGEKGNAYTLRDDMVQYSIRSREFESQRALYESLLERLRAAGIEAGLESSEIDIVDSALIPAMPSTTPVSSTILTNAIFALLAGIILAFLLENLDTGLSSIAEIEAITELPSLAIIPKSRRPRESDSVEGMTTAQKSIQILSAPKSQFSEAFRALRTSLLLSRAGHAPQVILVTSATPAEGKTTVSTNLACVLAQRNVKVLLIDADLRRPSVHHRFGLTGKTGLTTVLTGACSLEDALQNVPEVPNLDLLACGPVPPFPTEMLGSESMASLLERCTHIYTHIVMDSPPILSVTDGVILARLSDAVALVVRHGKPTKHVVRRARDLLVRAGAPVTGVVLNSVDLRSPEYYGYYGNYNYSYYSSDSAAWEPTNSDSNTGSQKPDGE
ncbi:MAG: GumC family protein [Acidobacteriaceae bacterium]